MLPGSIERLGPLGALFSRGALPLIRRELMVLVPVCLAFWVGRRLLTGNGSEPESRS
jgi:hypothetical protein